LVYLITTAILLLLLLNHLISIVYSWCSTNARWCYM